LKALQRQDCDRTAQLENANKKIAEKEEEVKKYLQKLRRREQKIEAIERRLTSCEKANSDLSEEVRQK
jgi:peptidoglycan hydrolase CwlO-like protein